MRKLISDCNTGGKGILNRGRRLTGIFIPEREGGGGLLQGWSGDGTFKIEVITK